MENAELIDLFRNVERSNHPVCNGCPMKYTCDKNQITRCLFGSAADALEADEQQIADLQKQVNEFIKNETHSSVIKAMSKQIAEQQKQIAQLYILLNNRINEIAELEAQLPKEGKWINKTDGYYFWHGKCPFCNHEYNIDSYYADMNYCPNCGARMKGEQE